MKNTIFFIVLTLTIINHVNSLRCFQCENCPKEGTSGNRIIECGTGATICYKQQYSAFGVSYTRKGCAPSCNNIPINFGATNYCCDTDVCNSSTRLTTKLPIFLLLTGILAIFLGINF